MINFFRKTRKKLADDNKPLKYARYAIGEILLVVIGILIALQINNWNELTKERLKEQKILEELVETLEANSEILTTKIERDITRSRSCEIILNALKNKLPYDDSLKVHFRNAQIQGAIIFLNDAGFEGLRNAGFDIIRTDSLRKQIIQLFEVSYNEMKELFNYFKLLQPVRDHHVDKFFYREENALIPNNYEGLFGDQYYIGFTKSVQDRMGTIIAMEMDRLMETQRVLELIKDELEEFD